VPVIVGPQSDGARAVIAEAARRIGAPTQVWGEDFRAYPERDRLVYEEEALLWDLPDPALPGPHQIVNAGVAAAAARACGFDQEAVREGLRTAQWPGRLQRATHGPLAAIARDGGAELWIDGGHNPAAGEALAASLGQMRGAGDRSVVLISAFSANKDASAFLAYFEGLAARVIAISFDGGREGMQSAQTVADAARKAGLPAQTAAGLEEAVHDALEDFDRPRILVCGSLYLAGAALALGGGEAVQTTPG
jgi:dihydrofolate synthase/folylpolyglutamate synthase